MIGMYEIVNLADGKATAYEETEALTEREKAIRAAAYIDTDGSIYINKPVYILVCKMSTTTIELLEWLQREYGGSICPLRGKRKDGYNRKAYFEWRIAAKKAEPFLRAILPFLVIKKEQARCGLELRAHQGNHMRGVPYEVKAQKWEYYYRKMKALNA